MVRYFPLEINEISAGKVELSHTPVPHVVDPPKKAINGAVELTEADCGVYLIPFLSIFIVFPLNSSLRQPTYDLYSAGRLLNSWK